jgi:hypothetical protein
MQRVVTGGARRKRTTSLSEAEEEPAAPEHEREGSFDTEEE